MGCNCKDPEKFESAPESPPKSASAAERAVYAHSRLEVETWREAYKKALAEKAQAVAEANMLRSELVSLMGRSQATQIGLENMNAKLRSLSQKLIEAVPEGDREVYASHLRSLSPLTVAESKK